MRFIITAQSSPDQDANPAVRQLTGSADLPPEILQLITEAAPTWSAAAWQAQP